MNNKKVLNNEVLFKRDLPEHEFSEAIEAPIERKVIRNIIFIITLSIASLVVWSVFSQVEEIAKAQGQVVPLGHRQIIQSQLGGTISSLEVEEGDVVEKGDILAHFVSINSESAKEELLSQRANIVMTIERLNAFKEKREADFSQFSSDFPSLVIQQRSSLMAMKNELGAIEALSASDIAKSHSEFEAVEREIPALKDQIVASEKTLEMMSTLLETGGVSRLRYLETKQKLDSYKRELASLNGKKDVIDKNLENLKSQLNQKEASLFKEVGEQLTKSQGELLVTNARLKASNSQVSQSTIIAPVKGIIQSIPSTTIGSVVAPGGTVVVIVPTTKTALLEAKLSPRDIGFVTVGQTARIKIDAFDYSRYGALDGIVKKISPSTDADERGGVFYKVQISIEKPYFGETAGRFDLIPGMTGEADIVTGDKTIFEYLWKPVFTNVSSAFGER